MRRFLISALCLLAVSCHPSVRIDKGVLENKIKGAWAGQTIGCAFGGPTEFKYSSPIPDSIEVSWTGKEIEYYFDSMPGMYDDIYMDLTFLDVLDKKGSSATSEDFASRIAASKFMLWHANQAARYNLLGGMNPPESGYWKNNPHADDIDFQIEADFAGIVNPGMPAYAAALCDSVGHIMNYGDGWYGGVFIAEMYSLAFISSDVPWIVEQACDVIPEETKFHKVIKDVIEFHKSEPDDWRACWEVIEQKYGTDTGCPSFLCKPGNIDATINSAYVAIGLLYGDSDFGKSMEIAARCGNDSDCNPSSVGGILGTIIGYDSIPDKWIGPLKECEDKNFAYTDINLKKAYELSCKIAQMNLDRADRKSRILPKVSYEQSFEGLQLDGRKEVWVPVEGEFKIPFEGKGIVVKYYFKQEEGVDPDYVAEVSASIDGAPADKEIMPVDETRRKQEIYHNYDLDNGPHVLTLSWENPVPGLEIYINSIITYK